MRAPYLPAIAATLLSASAASSAQAATVPDHDPLTIVIVSDEVNPHGLSDPELTQPGDLRTALTNAASGLSVASVEEFSSACVDDALTALAAGADVFIYFAHLSATSCAGGDAQGELTAAVQAHLEGGGGVVVFHHGVYQDSGKESILQLLGATAGQIAWEPADGQAVIATGGDHFVVTNALAYDDARTIGDDSIGVPSAEYPAFVNIPDERYPGLSLQAEAGETRTILFVSDYDGAQVLGYDLRRPTWAGHVVLYQPGEYQPSALDDLTGRNFQVLANAIYYTATTQDEPSGDDGTDGPGDDGPTDDGPGDDGPADDGVADDTAGEGPADGDDGDTAADNVTAGSDGTGSGASDGGTEGCACGPTAPRSSWAWLLGLLVLGVVGPRRPD